MLNELRVREVTDLQKYMSTGKYQQMTVCSTWIHTRPGILSTVIYDIEINIYSTSSELTDYTKDNTVVNKDGKRPIEWPG